MLAGATWPLLVNESRRNKTNNTFGYVRNGGKKPHQGWDFKAVIGTPCYAVGDGEVQFVQDRGDYGSQICISFTAGEKTWYAFYAHLQHVWVAAGDKVKLDDEICRAGESGNARGMSRADQHLHFEIRTKVHCGLGLEGRVSPLQIFGVCPLNGPIPG